LCDEKVTVNLWAKFLSRAAKFAVLVDYKANWLIFSTNHASLRTKRGEQTPTGHATKCPGTTGGHMEESNDVQVQDLCRSFDDCEFHHARLG
jgi:hypothetical protein